MNYVLIENSPLRHTYPYAKHDVELTFGTAEEMKAETSDIFSADEQCRRIVVAVPEGDVDAISECENAGFRYVLDVQLRDGQNVSLMVAEPEWVQQQKGTIEEMELK